MDAPVKTDFYSSIPRSVIKLKNENEQINENEQRIILNASDTWVHVGWIADPKTERYDVFIKEVSKHNEVEDDSTYVKLGRSKYGSYLIKDLKAECSYVIKVEGSKGVFVAKEQISTTKAVQRSAKKAVIKSKWQYLYKPSVHGDYVNDHCIYRDLYDNWRLAGITSKGMGDYSREKYFTYALCEKFPYDQKTAFKEEGILADYSSLAWAPCVNIVDNTYYMWYSPHKAYCMKSKDGISWQRAQELEFYPAHPQFRDPYITEAAPGQWLMYCTARHRYYSSIDIYQSFDGLHWQYIRRGLKTGLGFKKAAPQASTESPFVLKHENMYYLSFTYNNNSFFFGCNIAYFKKMEKSTKL